MDLKNKLTELLSRFSVSKKYVNELETICDDFAIGFAEWLSIKGFKEYSNGWASLTDKKNYTTKELLQIYKDIQK